MDFLKHLYVTVTKYKGILLFNAICHSLYFLCNDFITTSDMQFEFKPKAFNCAM